MREASARAGRAERGIDRRGSPWLDACTAVAGYAWSPILQDTLRFHLNGRPVEPGAVSPTTTLLDWLRGPAALAGTKEGCAEGDCGACTVVLETPEGRRVPVNACLTLLGQLHGRTVRTVEGLRGADGAPHPVQTALAEADATQCGFCTPGIVMTAWAHAREGGSTHEALAGNLCRCTGYRPIVGVLEGLAADPAPAGERAPAADAARFTAPGQVFHLPATLAEALALRREHPEAWVLAGGTDLGLRVSEGRERPAVVLCLLNVAELAGVTVTAGGLRVGATASYDALLRALPPVFGPFAALLRRLGSRQIRGLGTLGGNLGTASPIGDALPALVALGATVHVRSAGRGARSVPVAAFLTGYRRNALAADELIEAVELPAPPAGAVFACEKLSKRHDQDIAAIGAAFLLRLDDAGRVVEARLAFGGMGPTVARAAGAEAALVGAEWSAAAAERAAAALAGDFAPLSDARGTAGYRALAAGNLLRRLWWRTARPDAVLDVVGV